MIKNERQLRITNKKLRDFELALDKLNDDSEAQNELRLKMQKDALACDIESMRLEINEYEKLKDGGVTEIKVHSFHELPEAIIKARIARSMTQKALASSLGMKEQQIQRYEQNNYASVSFSKIEKIVEALGITIEERVHLG